MPNTSRLRGIDRRLVLRRASTQVRAADEQHPLAAGKSRAQRLWLGEVGLAHEHAALRERAQRRRRARREDQILGRDRRERELRRAPRELPRASGNDELHGLAPPLGPHLRRTLFLQLAGRLRQAGEESWVRIMIGLWRSVSRRSA